jgi:hypothetical protein
MGLERHRDSYYIVIRERKKAFPQFTREKALTVFTDSATSSPRRALCAPGRGGYPDSSIHLRWSGTDLQLRDSAGLPYSVTGFPLAAFASGRKATPTLALGYEIVFAV